MNFRDRFTFGINNSQLTAPFLATVNEPVQLFDVLIDANDKYIKCNVYS